MWSVTALSRELAEGRTTSRALLEQALARIADPAGEGARAFLKVYADEARAAADFSDRLRRAGVVRSAVEGLPVSVKDLYDVAGDADARGLEAARGCGAGEGRRAGGGAPARRGRGDRRAHQHGGVRLRHHGPQSPLRHAEESVGPEDGDACRAGPRAARAWLRPTAWR
jgi:hypothetical protein